MALVKYPDTKNPLNFYELSKPSKGLPWILPKASDLPTIPKGMPGYGCFSSPNISVGIPLINSTSIGCEKGYYCPYYNRSDANTIPVACPPDPICQINRVFSDTCLPQGRYEPMLCLSSFYCPDSSTIIPCPEGYFCPRGSQSPIACQFLSSCPAGSSFESHYGLTLIVIIIDIVLLFILLGKRIAEIRKAGQPLTSLLPASIAGIISKSKQKSKSRAPSIVPAESAAKVHVDAAAEMVEKVRKLVSGFKEAIGENLRMNFGFKDLSLTLPSGITVLKGVSGQIRAGRMTAIMGPSGAGKTTFMNVLMGKVNRTGGELKINGVVTEMQKYKKIIGYVPQEDIMHRELTVRENILYSARIRLPRSWTNAMIEKHTDDVIEALNLTKVKHTPIGDELTRGISGGQRKRVNVGMELVACPLAVFLDEPTSGLDSTSALDLADILRSVAHLGLTIVSVIHQPRIEIFERFDDVLLISPGGLTAYFGPIGGAKAYFESLGFYFDPSANVADILMDILSGRGISAVEGAEPLSSKEIVEMWEKRVSADDFVEIAIAKESDSVKVASSSTSAGPNLVSNNGTASADADHTAIANMAAIAKARGANVIKQIILAHNRSLLQQSRFLGAFFLECFVGMFAGFIMGISSNGASEYVGIPNGNYAILSSSPNNWFLALYGMLVGISIALAGGPAGVKVFGEEKPVYWRETASGHNSFSYYIGKTTSVLYRLTLSSLHFTALYYLLATPPIPLHYQVALNLLNFFCIYGVSAVISMIVRRENASLLAVIIGLFSAVFCGFGLTLDAAQAGGYIFIFNIGANRWAAESQFTLWTKPTQDVYDQVYGADNFGYVPNQEVRNILTMLGLGLGYRAVAYVLLIALNRQKQR
ncbi:hypothetical protein HDU97_008035 [Phlyctochytrium planicorne]|nr:hypothetical protein HDU97_008035 [Phlyctochytrium planicorne]